MKKILIGSIMSASLVLTSLCAQTLAPDGTYVSGDHAELAPDGTYVGGTPELAPDGSYVGGKPNLAPDGTYTGGGSQLAPDGSLCWWKTRTRTQWILYRRIVGISYYVYH